MNHSSLGRSGSAIATICIRWPSIVNAAVPGLTIVSTSPRMFGICIVFGVSYGTYSADTR